MKHTKILSTLLALVLCLTVFTACAEEKPSDDPNASAGGEESKEPADTVEDNGLGFKYSKDKGGYIVEALEGNENKEVVIPESIDGQPVVFVRDMSQCTKMTSIVIPDSVKEIGSLAFVWCEALTTVTMGKNVEWIGKSAFADCKNLASVTFSETLTTIEAFAFSMCTNLKTVELPDTVEMIAENAFSSCSALTKADLGNGLKVLGQSAFKGCSSLKSISIAEGVEYISESTFYNCSNLTVVSLPSTIKSLGGESFYLASALFEIKYNGTSEQWSNVSKREFWDVGTGNYTITCTDGTYVEPETE